MFAKLLTMSLVLVGPEGAAIFGLLAFTSKKIEGHRRRLTLAVATIAIATIMALAFAFFGSTVLEYLGIALGTIGVLGGLLAMNTGADPWGYDLLKFIRKGKKQTRIVTRTSVELITPTASGLLLVQTVQVEKITEVEEADEADENGNKTTPESGGWLRCLANDLAMVFVPVVFPTSVGPAYIAWLINPSAAGKPIHPPLMMMALVIVITMLVTLLSMTVALLIGKGMPDRLGNFLARAGGLIFILFGIGSFCGGLNMLSGS